MSVWDRGSYELHEWTDDVIVVTLHGRRLEGTYNLVCFPRAGESAWLLFRRRPDHRPRRSSVTTARRNELPAPIRFALIVLLTAILVSSAGIANWLVVILLALAVLDVASLDLLGRAVYSMREVEAMRSGGST